MMNMKYWLVALCAAIMSFCSCAPAGNTPEGEGEGEGNKEQTYDVYLLIGQSNMAGRGVMLPGDEAPIEGAWLLNAQDVPEPACAPMNRHSTIRKGVTMQIGRAHV